MYGKHVGEPHAKPRNELQTVAFCLSPCRLATVSARGPAVPLLPARGLSASSAVPPPMINARARFAQASPEANCKQPEGCKALRLHARPPCPVPLLPKQNPIPSPPP